MTKTHAEFLEELKEYLNDELAATPGNNFGYANCCNHILDKIEQFEAEKKVNDENK
jgi:hypothetical protein